MKISAHEEYGLRCLVQLARAEVDAESLTLNQIADREGLSVANAGKLMWVLVKAGLVRRYPSTTDRRIQLADLTPQALCDKVLEWRLGAAHREDDMCLLAVHLS